MDSFELNKGLCAILLALLIGMVSQKIADWLVAPTWLAKDVYQIDVAEESASQTAATTEEIIEAVEPLLAKASAENGQNIAKKCLQCHTFEKSGANKVGPNLWNIVGNKVAHSDSFAYSSAFKGHKGEWTYENLNHYLYKPQKFIPGTKMAFAGLKKGQERADLIAYLRTLSDTLKPLP
ncbi:MAG: cytochrome c family protein [Candidatus Paracaedimonas acanthamoebae]|uniref:Cytochrome c family protein n=1 Tax=Candidatus Paracaedimonas acanthamoebae TaxID=244581 RepID=A0A8J7TTR4_9PROT|nr:cytochrome c family protein [Candidatus Paracaedimonas acanthamoebae]